MTTLAEMATDIGAETRRTSSTDATAIARYIQDAIRHYSGKRFWWNEDQGASFNTAASTEYYAIPSPLRVVDSVLVDVSSSYPTTLQKRSNQWIEDRYVPSGTYTGQPYAWAMFNDQIRLYPIPDAVYAVKTQGYGIALPISTADDTTPWANEAHDLIKCRARALIERDWLMNPEGFQLYSVAEQQALQALQGENTSRTGGGKIRGWGIV